MDARRQLKVALVHDWLTNMGGAERVALALHDAFPNAPIYTSVYEPVRMPLFDGLRIRTTWLQRLPHSWRRLHKLFPTLRVRAFKALDLDAFDVIISSASAEAKQVQKRRAGQTHICYCHTPIRYYWSHYDEYRRDPGFAKLNWLIRLIMPAIVPGMRRCDHHAAGRVDAFIANSREVQGRIKRYYQRPSCIIHPPVDVERLRKASRPRRARRGFVVVGRQVPYKRIDLAVDACTRLHAPLTVLGDGPQHADLERRAGTGVKFVTDASDAEIAAALGSARAFLFPAEEDFGIVQVEALAAGTPVIAYGKGGALDVITDGENGVLFGRQTAVSLAQAIERFNAMDFEPEALQRQAQNFSRERFVREIRELVARLA